jgi:hypothetical protein
MQVKGGVDDFMVTKTPTGVEPVRVHASLTLPVVLFVVFGGLGIFLLFVSFAKGISLAPGLGFLVLALVFFIGQRAYQIELTEEKLVYRKLGRKREILIGEIGQILITEGFNSFLEMFTKPRIRIEVHHISDDETKNIYMASSIGIFHPSEIQKILASLRDKASV